MGIRSIPTRVGKTWVFWRCLFCKTVHPHACGENCSNPNERRCACGPSPRVWGKHSQSRERERPVRSIPTRVGKTCVSVIGLLCLERSIPTRVGKTNKWGCPRSLLARSIPTRVGKTRSIPPRCTRPPRSIPTRVGKTSNRIKPYTSSSGPSPRVWGKRDQQPAPARVPRSIPTRVGKTNAASRSVLAQPVHPHACGENVGCRGARASQTGPSPRVWGKRGIPCHHQR